MTSCQLPEEDHEIWSQRCVAYETFSILVPDNDLNLLELLILLLDESKHSRLYSQQITRSKTIPYDKNVCFFFEGDAGYRQSLHP